MSETPLISIVTTLYKSSEYINEFYNRINDQVKTITNLYEIIFVDDGSPDDSLSKVLELKKQEPQIKVIELSRNFGHHKAILTGLKFSKGKFIFLIDCDLEEDPELISTFWKEIQKGNHDIVIGVQKERKGSFIRKYISSYFYVLFNFFSETKIIKNQVVTRIMNREYVDAIIKFKEADFVLAGVTALTGFSQGTLVVEKKYKGSSTYNFNRQIAQLIDAITSFSSKPLIYIFYFGLNIVVLSVAIISYYLFQKIFSGIPIQGWTSLILSLWFIGGIIIFSIGTLGIYIDRIYRQVKNRPFTIVKKYHE